MSHLIEPAPPTRLRRVLVVEDDAVNRTYLRLNLEKWGYQVLSTLSAEAAQQEFNQRGPNHFDCVISDYWLPGQTGLELLHWLKTQDASLATIILTADGERKLVTESLRAGAVDFLEKPVNVQKLQAALERAANQTDRQRHMLRSEFDMENLGRTQRWMVRNAETQSVDLCFHPKFEAGGDFLAHFQINSDAYCCLLTDVSGHDPQAAYISAYFHGIFRGMTLREAPLTSIFSYFNDFLINEWNQSAKLRTTNTGGTSVAAAALLVDARRQTASLLNCGAPVPIQVSPDGRAQLMGETGGPPLGWFPDTEIRETHYSITGGSTVYLWTDGLAELADSQGAHPLCLALALQREGKSATQAPILRRANDDILFAAVKHPNADAETGLLQPLIVAEYPGDQESNIDELSDGWRRGLKMALPELGEAAEHDILLATREAMLNALKHGCRGDAGQTVRFQVSYHRLRRFVRVWVEDPGPGHQFDVAAKADNLAHVLTDRHHGLIFITNLAQHVTFERNGATVILDFQL
jgi:FixJ family two-component response regulator/anti-sigma regulatory factor (Ser/Thr protein kinase)